MPTFRVWPREPTDDDDVFWVYALDDWDARHQITVTLGFDTQDKARYACEEDAIVTVPLNHIAHKDGKFTVCPTPDAGEEDDFDHKVLH